MFSLVISLILNILFFIHKGNSKVSMDTFIYNSPPLQRKKSIIPSITNFYLFNTQRCA